MPCQTRFGTAGASGGGFSAQPGTLQAAFIEGRHEPRWSWQRRSPKTWRDRNQWHSLWSFGCRIGCGDANMDGAASIGNGMADTDLFEPYSCDGDGNQTKRFIRGIVKDSVDVAVAGALVQGFVTATDAYVGEVQSNLDGTYTLGTETLPGVAHYLVAYKPGSPDVAGTTVNTITSTNVDGS
jgi:hypothetical protein